MSYSIESIRKAVSGLNDHIKFYSDAIKSGETLKVSISTGNKKIGRVMNVSLAPIVTCGSACNVCMGLCYDIKAVLQYGNVMKARARNTAIYRMNSDLYFAQIRGAIRRRRSNKLFRWHVAGDIPNVDYLAEMVAIARENPDFIFWTYTKQYHIVNAYVAQHGGDMREAIPTNLSIMFSVWRGLPCVNPYSFPVFDVIFNDDTTEEKLRKMEYFRCPGNCDLCKEHNRGCVTGESASVWEH